jgi:membrane-associated protease RseP (regulator of RpoE activity)
VRNRFGRVVGAFNLQKFWPVPLAIISVVVGQQVSTGGAQIPMPGWWPLMGALPVGAALGSVVAALGYGELAVTCLPRERVRVTSLHLAIFSLVLLGLAVLAAHVPQTAVLAALFAPLGHEVVIHAGQRSELQGPPRFVPPARGVMVLGVRKASPSHEAGLRSGDVILRIGDLPVNTRAELTSALEISGSSFEVEYRQESAAGYPLRRARVAVDPNVLPGRVPSGRGRFGVLTVPEPGDLPTVDITMDGPLQRFARRLFGARGR